jgi:Outer membrane protein beta-barrel domain
LPYGGGTDPGWNAGAGVEFTMTDNWTVKAEYLYAIFENATCAASSCGPAAPATVSFTICSTTDNVGRDVFPCGSVVVLADCLRDYDAIANM